MSAGDKKAISAQHRHTSSENDIRTALFSAPRSLDQAFERNRPQQAIRRDVPVFNVGVELWLHHVAFGFLIGRVSFDLGLTTLSSCFLIWFETVREGTRAARQHASFVSARPSWPPPNVQPPVC